MDGWKAFVYADLFPASLAFHQRLSSLEVLDALCERFHPPALRRERVLGRAEPAEPAAPAGRTESVLVEQAPDTGEDERADSDDDRDHDDDSDERLLFSAELHAPERTLHTASIRRCCQRQSISVYLIGYRTQQQRRNRRSHFAIAVHSHHPLPGRY